MAQNHIKGLLSCILWGYKGFQKGFFNASCEGSSQDFCRKGLGLGVSCFLLWSLWRIRVVGARCSGAWGLEF